jgi:putative glutamine amidotransferase
VSARAPDGVIEAIEVPARRFALGVQWHPEALARHEPRHAAIYAGLVAAAGRGAR